MSNKGLIVGLIVIIILVAVFGLAGQSMNQSGGVLKIGFIAPLTGDAAQYGESESRAVVIAVDEINQSGGVLGSRIELISEDGKCDPQAGGSAAQKLVNIDGVKLIIGGACSGETLAAANVTEPAQVILISPSASSPDVTHAGDFVFRTYPSDALAGSVAARYAFNELGVRKAAVIAELTDYAQGLQDVFIQAFKDLGGIVVHAETYTTGEVDFRTPILKIKAENPDVVYIVPQTATPGVAIVKQLKDNNVGAVLLTGEVLLDREIVTENGAVLEGVLGVESAIDYEGNAQAHAFREIYREEYGGADPGLFAANAYDAVYLLKDAIEAVGSVDTVAIRDWLYAVQNWQGTVGMITMDENGDPVMGLNVRKIVSSEVTDIGPYTP